MATLAAEAAAVGAGAASAASAAFNYNRANYQWDQGAMRWNRYTTGFNMAQAQTKMYREDIHDLTSMTVTKQDTYHTIGTIFFVLNFQLIMAGRLGVHGPSPPGWLLGLYWTNICSALMFLTAFTWMAMHASARAQAGGAYMLTRHVRLPIPTPKQLDRARTTGNNFEKQRLADMLRIPFVMPASKESYEEVDSETGAQSSTPVSNRRMPKWYKDEVKELHDDGEGPCTSTNPVHFELHRGLQEEWWAYDVYSRVGVLYFMSHWLSAASLYSMCHIFTELRCIWPAYTCTACFVAAHVGVLSVDIVNKPRESGMNIQVEKYVPFVPFIAVVGMTIDYSVVEDTQTWKSVVYALAWVCYIIQYAWAFRLWDLAAPQDGLAEQPEVPGRPWHPKEWPLPPAFQEAVYVLSAPKTSEQPCLLQELNATKGVKADHAPVKKAPKSQPSMYAWKLFRGACITTFSMWTLIVLGRVFEQINGERMLLKQEGRVERWPSHMQPWMPPWSRFGTRNEYCHAGGCDRRLSQKGDVSDMAMQLVTLLQPIAAAFEHLAPARQPMDLSYAPESLTAAEVAWPSELRPTALAAKNAAVAALSRDSRGVIMHMDQKSSISDLAAFVLQGIDALGEISGVAWTDEGLMVTTSSGMLAECAGSPIDGLWPCQQFGPQLPIHGSSLRTATASRIAGTNGLRAALSLDDDDDGTLLLLETDEAGQSWLPAGEVRMPEMMHKESHLSMSSAADELWISAGDGEVLKWSLGAAEPEQIAPQHQPVGGLRPAWHAATTLTDGRLLHLATQPSEAAPKLYVRVAGN